MTTVAHREHPNYMGIFWWLLALTILEIGVIYLPIPHLAIAILLVGMALTKAALVGLYFMHLRFERVSLGLIALTPLVICVFLIFMLVPDLSAVQRSTVRSEPVAAEGAHH
jgi:cytochrome c oxidase subunit 4